MNEVHKYKVAEPRKLSSWKKLAQREISKWLNDDEYRKEVTATTMKNESMGEFTKFLYHFAYLCECGWGVMVDFDERKQRVFLPDHYYKWMHKLRDEIIAAEEMLRTLEEKIGGKIIHISHEQDFSIEGGEEKKINS